MISRERKEREKWGRGRIREKEVGDDYICVDFYLFIYFFVFLEIAISISLLFMKKKSKL